MGKMIHVGHAEMDAIHDELAELLDTAGACRDAASLGTQLDRIIDHTRNHFDTEEQWMEQLAFPMRSEHRAEHRQLLAELEMMRRRLRPLTLPLVLSFVRERVPDWLVLHLQRMDSLLAAHLNNS